MNKSLSGAAFLALAILDTGRASNIIYDVDLTSGAASVTGFIETDGTIGTLSGPNFLDWNLEVDDGTDSGPILGPLETGSNSVVVYSPSSASGSLTDLTFDTSTTNDSFLEFATFDGSGASFCAQDQGGGCGGSGGLQWTGAGVEEASIPTNGVTTIGTAEGAVPEQSTLMLMFAALAISPLLRKRILSSKRSARPT
jgi:hypothetical protein